MEAKRKRNVSCKISLYLRKNKTLSDGTHPIFLRCSYYGSAEKSTATACKSSDWDSVREMVKSRNPMHRTINSIIMKLKNECISRKLEYERLGISFTASMVLGREKNDSEVLSPEVSSLVGVYTDYYHVKSSTVGVWNCALSSLLDFMGGRQLFIGDVSISFAKRFASYLERKHCSSSTIRSYMGKLHALCSFGVMRGLLPSNPLEGYNYRQLYKDGNRTNYIHWRSMEYMKGYLYSLLVDGGKGGMWRFRDGIERMFNIGRGCDYGLLSIYLFMLDCLFQGLSPVDLCMLKFEDIEFRMVGGRKYLHVETKRQKTGKVVKVTFPMEGYNLMMVNCILFFRGGGGYLLPIFDGYTIDKRDYYMKKLGGLLVSTLRPKLEVHLRRVNDIIISHNVEAGDNVPLIESPEDITYYTARHSFATNYCLRGGSPIQLATLLGRSVNTISAYVKLLTEESDLIDATSVMDSAIASPVVSPYHT